MSEFGGQTVAFVAVSQTGEPGWGGLREKSRVATPLSGCRFRSHTSDETPVTQTDVATEIWKLTAPPDAAALVVAANGELLYDGSDHPELLDPDSDAGKAATFQIDGPIQAKRDMDGSVHHVTIWCKRQAG